MNEERQGARPTKKNGSRGARSGVKVSLRTKKELRPNQPLFRAEPATPAESASAGKMNTAEIEVQPRQADRQGGWNIGGGATPGWGPLDLTGGGGKLPEPGTYVAVIADVKLIDKTDVLRAIVNFRLDGTEAAPAPVWLMLASRRGPVDDHSVVDGHRLLNRLAAAAMVMLEAPLDPYSLPGLFIGRKVRLTVAHEVKDGVGDLVARAFAPL